MAKFREVCILHGSDIAESGCFTKEGQVAATGGKGRIVSLWDADGGEQVMKMPPHLAAISALNFNDDNTLLGSGDTQGKMKVWDLREARLMRNLEGHHLAIKTLGFYPNSDACIVASGSIEGRVRLWDVRRKGFFRTFGRKGGPSINSLAFSPDGRLLAIGDEDGLKLWDVNNDSSPVASYTFQNASSVRFHHRDMLLAAASNNGSNTNVHFIELENFKEESSCVISSSKVDDLQFHPEKNAVLSCTKSSLIVAGWDPTGVHDTVLSNFEGVYSAKAFSDHFVVLARDERACAKIVQIDLAKVALERPETPQSSGLRKTFDQIRPDTMESKFNGESPRSEEGIDDKVEIADMGKFEALFQRPGIERSKSEMPSHIPRSDFNKVINPRHSLETLIKQPMQREKSVPITDPYSQFSKPYRSRHTPSQGHDSARSSQSRISSAKSVPSLAPASDMLAAQSPRLVDPKSHGDQNRLSNQGISRVATVDILSANILDSLKNRRQNLELVTAQWPDVEAVIDSAISLGDQSTIIDLLNILNRRVNVWSLSLCAKLLHDDQPCSLPQMLLTNQQSTLETLLDALFLIGTYFSQLIFDNVVSTRNDDISRDIQSDERKQRAMICYNSLRQAKSLLQTKTNSQGHLNQRIREVLVALANF